MNEQSLGVCTHLLSGAAELKLSPLTIGGGGGPAASRAASSSLPRSTQRFSCAHKQRMSLIKCDPMAAEGILTSEPGVKVTTQLPAHLLAVIHLVFFAEFCLLGL